LRGSKALRTRDWPMLLPLECIHQQSAQQFARWGEELAQLARAHNDANIICIPARFVSDETAFFMIEKFFSTEFEGGRHQKRIDKINCV